MKNFNFLLNISISAQCFTSLGMSFHSRGPITLNDLFAKVCLATLGMSSFIWILFDRKALAL